MAVTIHIPEIHTPNLRNFAVAGVAVLVAATAVLGVQTLTDNSTTTTATTRDVVEVTTGNFADTSGVAEWAQANGLSGLSPTSVGAAVGATQATTTQSAVTGPMTNWRAPVANVGAEASTATQSGGFTTTEQFMEANVSSFYTPSVADLDLSAVQSIVGVPSVDALARLVGIGVAVPTAPDAASQSGGFTTTEQFMEANVSSFFTPVAPGVDQSALQSIVGVPSVDALARLVDIGVAVPTALEAPTQSGGFASQAQFMQANVGPVPAAEATAATQYDPYPADPGGSELARSNFGSDIEWLEANGWG